MTRQESKPTAESVKDRQADGTLVRLIRIKRRAQYSNVSEGNQIRVDRADAKRE